MTPRQPPMSPPTRRPGRPPPVALAPVLRTAALLTVAVLTAVGCAREPGPAQIADLARGGNLDVTFLVTADTHFGATASDDQPVERVHDRAIAAMNAIAGKAWPAAVGGTVPPPRGLLIAGDLTENGFPGQWRQFARYYLGPDARLKLPVYETIGNHENHLFSSVIGKVKARHGGSIRYGWDWGDLHLASLGDGPDSAGLAWLARDLARVGRQRPIVLFLHFPLAGPYEATHWFGKGDYRDRLAAAIDGYNVIAIFHGHYHGGGFYRWHNADVFNVGSAKHNWRSFAVVRVTDDRLTVASWNYERDGWWWHFSVPINGQAGPRHIEPGGMGQPYHYPTP